MDSFDLVVIGSGPAGEKGAAQAAYFWQARCRRGNAATHLGGAGVNTGTCAEQNAARIGVPFSGLRQRGLYGVDYSLREGLTVQGFMHRKDAVVSAERLKIASVSRRLKIELIGGQARVRRPAQRNGRRCQRAAQSANYCTPG